MVTLQLDVASTDDDEIDAVTTSAAALAAALDAGASPVSWTVRD